MAALSRARAPGFSPRPPLTHSLSDAASSAATASCCCCAFSVMLLGSRSGWAVVLALRWAASMADASSFTLAALLWSP